MILIVQYMNQFQLLIFFKCLGNIRVLFHFKFSVPINLLSKLIVLLFAMIQTLTYLFSRS